VVFFLSENWTQPTFAAAFSGGYFFPLANFNAQWSGLIFLRLPQPMHFEFRISPFGCNSNPLLRDFHDQYEFQYCCRHGLPVSFFRQTLLPHVAPTHGIGSVNQT